MSKAGLRQCYDALPKRAPKAPRVAFVEHIAKVCRVHPNTVRYWIYGYQKPDALRKELLSKELGIPEEELF